MQNSDLKKIRARILDIIRAGPGVVTTTEIASAFKLSWNTAEKYLLELALENQVQRIKKAGVNLWVITRTLNDKHRVRGIENFGRRHE